MPDCMREFLTELAKLAPVVFLSVFGGVVSYINKPKDEFSWCFMLVGVVTAAFVGIVVHYLLQSTSFPPGIKSAAIAVSGYASRDVLFLLKKRLLKTAKKELG
ncbi:MAG: hypothetical protein GY864_13725 [Desulfobacterales bacterium]|nr:hypothetical protein [Desulfobacterales bacterium]